MSVVDVVEIVDGVADVREFLAGNPELPSPPVTGGEIDRSEALSLQVGERVDPTVGLDTDPEGGDVGEVPRHDVLRQA